MVAALQPLAGERVAGESRKAIVACNDYLRLGPGRALRSLVEKYREVARNRAPTHSLGTLNSWSQKYEWQKRADGFDAAVDAEKEARRREIMQSGLALDYERVVELKRVADFLIGQVHEVDETGNHPRVWLPDVKQIGGGEFAERVDIVRFNNGILEQLRGTLDDIAKEVGDRRQKVDMSHTATVQFTSDDYAKAKRELEEWEGEFETRKSSGSSAP